MTNGGSRTSTTQPARTTMERNPTSGRLAATVRSSATGLVNDRETAMHARRSAFTLIELLLVMLIIVMMAVLTYPNIESMYAGVKLQAAADHLVSQFATARAHAIDEQRVYRFAIQPGTSQYRLAPDDPQ